MRKRRARRLRRLGRKKEIFVSRGRMRCTRSRAGSMAYWRLMRSKSIWCTIHMTGTTTLTKLSDSIVVEVEKWLDQRKAREAEWFNDESQYSRAIKEPSRLERMVIGKMEYYLTGVGGDVTTEPMELVARRAESEMIRNLEESIVKPASAAPSAFSCLPFVMGWFASRWGINTQARKLTLELCKRRAAITHSVDETDDLGEPPLVASGASGNIEEQRLLMLAGCHVDSACVEDGSTALHRACMMGNLEYARGLLDAGADISRKDSKGRTGLFVAAELGHSRVVGLMLERGGKELAMIVNINGSSCAFNAAMNGHTDALRCLHEVGGRELIMLVDNDGRSCAHAAH